MFSSPGMRRFTPAFFFWWHYWWFMNGISWIFFLLQVSLFIWWPSFVVAFETMGTSFQISIQSAKWSGKEYKWNSPLAPRSLMEPLHYQLHCTTNTNTNSNTNWWWCNVHQCTATVDGTWNQWNTLTTLYLFYQIALFFYLEKTRCIVFLLEKTR